MSYKKTTIGAHCSVTSSKRFHASERTKEGVPFYCSKEIIQKVKGEDVTECDYISEDAYKSVKEKYGVPQVGDLLITTRGTYGVPYIYKDYDKFYFADGNLTWLKDFDDELDVEYLYYWINSYEGQKKIDAIAKGTAQKAVPIATLKQIEIEIPDISTQKKVVCILKAYDELIENNQKQIKLLEEAAQRLYKEWFVDLRFPGYEETEIIDGIPNGWAKKSILENDIFIFSKNKVCPFDGEKQYYATADITGTTISADGATITYMNKPSRASVQPVNNSVWFARMSNTYKILNCFGESSHLANDSVISSGFAGFTALEGCFGFVYATIASKRFDDEKNRYATGATQVSLTNEGLKKIEILIPTIDIVQQYSRMVEPYLEKAELLKRNCKLLQQARDRLLPKLMSGEIEV